DDLARYGDLLGGGIGDVGGVLSFTLDQAEVNAAVVERELPGFEITSQAFAGVEDRLEQVAAAADPADRAKIGADGHAFVADLVTRDADARAGGEGGVATPGIDVCDQWLEFSETLALLLTARDEGIDCWFDLVGGLGVIGDHLRLQFGCRNVSVADRFRQR